MDTLSSPSTQRKRDPFQTELRAKMKDRRSRGLGTDVTPTDESEDEALGSDDDLLAEFNLTSKPKSMNQPGQSAGRKSPFDPFGKGAPPTTYGRKSPFDPLGKASSASQQQNSANPQSIDDMLFGKKSPTGKPVQNGAQEAEPSLDDLLFGKKQAPVKNGMAAGDQQQYGYRKDPMDSLFDKDSSPRGQYQKKPWQPPSYKKNTTQEQDNETMKPKASPRDHPFPPPRKHKTSLSEDSPRAEDGKMDYPKVKPRTRRLSKEQDEEKPKPRRQPKVDIFGSSTKSDDDDDEEEEVAKSFRKNAKGRASPSPGGRKTPSSRSGTPKLEDGKKESASGRKSPAKSSGILGLLTGDGAPKPKPRKMKSLLMSESEEEGDEHDENDVKHSKLKDSAQTEVVRKSRKSIPSPDRERESSVCREIEEDPDKKIREKREREKERAKRRESAGKQTEEHNMLENTIDLVADVQDEEEHEMSMKYIEPATTAKSKEQRKSTPGSRPGSSTSQVRPKPRYAKPEVPSSPEPYERPASFDSTTGIRQAVYDEWYKQKMEKSKQELREKKKKEKEEEEKMKKEKEEKAVENQVTYNSWAERKKPLLKEKAKEKRKEEEKKREKEQEELEKRKAAELTYKRWKEAKDEELKEKHRETKKAMMEKKQTEAEEKAIRKKDTMKIYEGWKAKKDNLLKTQYRETKKVEKEERKQIEKTQKEKEEEANRRYEMWIENKEKRCKDERRRKKFAEYSEERPAWSPAGKTVPFGH